VAAADGVLAVVDAGYPQTWSLAQEFRNRGRPGAVNIFCGNDVDGRCGLKNLFGQAGDRNHFDIKQFFQGELSQVLILGPA